MPSDPFDALADTLADFAAGMLKLLADNLDPAPESPAALEIAAAEHSGEWSTNPADDALGIVGTLTWSVTDHLAGAAAVIRARHMVCPYTLVRAAAENCARASHLAEAGIAPLERVRRVMNYLLDSMCQDLLMTGTFNKLGGSWPTDSRQASIDAIGRTAGRFGLRYRQARGPKSAYLGDPPKPVTDLIDTYTSPVRGLGQVYQQALSSVTHGRAHGLSQFMRNPLLKSATPGRVARPPTVTSVDLARELLIGPLAAGGLVTRLHEYTGWDASRLQPSLNQMVLTWGQIAQIPYPGPLAP